MMNRGAQGSGRVVLGMGPASLTPRLAPVIRAGRALGVRSPNVMETLTSAIKEVRNNIKLQKIWTPAKEKVHEPSETAL